MQGSYVVSLDTLQLLVLHIPPTLVLGAVEFGWTMLFVRGVKDPLQTVSTMDGVHITAVTAKMHLWFVQVSNSATNKFHYLTLCSLKAAGIVGGSSVEPLFCKVIAPYFLFCRGNHGSKKLTKTCAVKSLFLA